MSPRDRRGSGGAMPEVELAIIESDVHHLREQADRDRRGFSERMIELRKWRERLELATTTNAAHVARLADTCDRLEVARKADAGQLAELVAITHKARGAYWALAGIAGFAGLGTLLQIGKFLMEALR